MIRIPLNKQDQTNIAMDLKEFTLKERHLESTKDKLKARFFGLDHVIDQLIDSLRTWYHIPQFQTRPLVINLWGSAGTGKSQLINELIKELGLYDSSISLLAHDWSRSDISESVSALKLAENPLKAIFCLDDFQKLLKNDGLTQSWEVSINHPIWEILDEGSFRASKKTRYEFEIIEAISKGLNFMINSGLKIVNGFVGKEQIEDFESNKKFWEYIGKSKPKTWDDLIDADSGSTFIFNYHETKILFEAGHHGFENLEAFVAYLKTLDQNDVLELVNSILKRGLQFNRIDLSRSIFFVTGNLDDLVVYEDNQSPYLEISSPNQVREILWQYLPAELIARLGNNHIILPNPSIQTFKQVIQNELESIQTKFQDETGSILEFDNSVGDWLLNEGAIPGLGIRPVFSTIQNVIIDNLPSIMLGLSGFKSKADSVSISMDRGLDVKFWKGEKSILQSWHPVKSRRKSYPLSEGLNQNSN